MPIWQPTFGNTPPILADTMSPYYGIGDALFGYASFPVSTAWSSANRGIYVPLYIDQMCQLLKLWTVTGTTGATGNVDLGIYDSGGTLGQPGKRLASMGSTAQAAASLVQEFDVTDLRLYRNTYYLAMSASSAVATYHLINSGIQYVAAMAGCFQEASALPLPATATPVVMTTGQIPLIGFALRTLVA